LRAKTANWLLEIKYYSHTSSKCTLSGSAKSSAMVNPSVPSQQGIASSTTGSSRPRATSDIIPGQYTCRCGDEIVYSQAIEPVWMIWMKILIAHRKKYSIFAKGLEATGIVIIPQTSNRGSFPYFLEGLSQLLYHCTKSYWHGRSKQDLGRLFWALV